MCDGTVFCCSAMHRRNLQIHLPTGWARDRPQRRLGGAPLYFPGAFWLSKQHRENPLTPEVNSHPSLQEQERNTRHKTALLLLTTCLQQLLCKLWTAQSERGISLAFTRVLLSAVWYIWHMRPFCFMRKLVIEGQAWKALSMAMESQLEQAWDQYIWRQREALAKRKIKSCFPRGAKFPSKASYRSRPKSWSTCLGPDPTVPTSQIHINATWSTNSTSAKLQVLLWPLLPALQQGTARPWPAMGHSEMRLN